MFLNVLSDLTGSASSSLWQTHPEVFLYRPPPHSSVGTCRHPRISKEMKTINPLLKASSWNITSVTSPWQLFSTRTDLIMSYPTVTRLLPSWWPDIWRSLQSRSFCLESRSWWRGTGSPLRSWPPVRSYHCEEALRERRAFTLSVISDCSIMLHVCLCEPENKSREECYSLSVCVCMCAVYVYNCNLSSYKLLINLQSAILLNS